MMFWSGYSTYDRLPSYYFYKNCVRIIIHDRTSNPRRYRKVTIVTSFLMWTFHDVDLPSLDSYATIRLFKVHEIQ